MWSVVCCYLELFLRKNRTKAEEGFYCTYNLSILCNNIKQKATERVSFSSQRLLVVWFLSNVTNLMSLITASFPVPNEATL